MKLAAKEESENLANEIDVAVINYNTREDLKACLSTIAPEGPKQVIVVDNASSDGSAAMVRANHPQVQLFANNTNPGYGAAANQAIANCKSDYVLLLNSDTRLEPGALKALVHYLEMHPRAAIVGPRLANLDGSLQISCFPFPIPFYILLQASSLGKLVRFIPFIRDHYPPTWSHSHPKVVAWVLGGALAIRKSAFLEAGGFDASFFMYSEEVDLAYRLKQSGWEVHYAPVTNVVHIRGASTAQQYSDMEVQKYRSTIQFYRKHYSRRQLSQLYMITMYSMLRNIARDSVRLLLTNQSSERQKLKKNLHVWKRILDLRMG